MHLTLFVNNFKLKVVRKRIVQRVKQFLPSWDSTSVSNLLASFLVSSSPSSPLFSYSFLSHSLTHKYVNPPSNHWRVLCVHNGLPLSCQCERKEMFVDINIIRTERSSINTTLFPYSTPIFFTFNPFMKNLNMQKWPQ